MGVEQSMEEEMSADWVVLMGREGTVKAQGLGLGSECKVLGMGRKRKIGSQSKAQLGKLGLRACVGEGESRAVGRRGCCGTYLGGRQRGRQVG